METKLIDGKQIARDVRAELKEKVKKAVSAGMKAPKLVVILVGEDPASKIYVNNKEKACGWVSMKSETLRMPAETSEEEVLAKISELNADPEVNGCNRCYFSFQRRGRISSDERRQIRCRRRFRACELHAARDHGAAAPFRHSGIR